MKQIFTLLAVASAATAFSQVNTKPYFQQDVEYTIHVKLDDTKDEISGDESLVYKNNSPDQLTFIYMHLWPNGYKDDNTPLGQQLIQDGSLFMHYASQKDHGWIDSLDFKVDGQSVKLDYEPNSPDIGKITLNSPLAPGASITITTPFHVHLPSGKISRLGHIGQQYQITQWYPKPAVYDKDGWEQIPYLNQGEFYSEFGKYDVYISLPENYVLRATGDIVDNPKEEAFNDSLAEATKNMTSFDKKDDKFPESSKTWKTVHYHQEHVHDFAWFCDKRYHVLKGEVTLPHTGKKVTTWVLFTNQYAEVWKDGVQYVNDALYYYSKWNGDYLYDVCTAVDGALSAGGGMEYPNITVIGAAGNPLELDIVITHEVGHNWFYGMLGSNERKHAWMDEGINSANEERYVATKYPNAALVGGKNGPNAVSHMFDLDRYDHSAEYYQGYLFSARLAMDQPIETTSADFTEINYGTIVYMKSAVIFTYLRAYLGDSVYDACFQDYFAKWSLHHPMPEDCRECFERVSGKKLDWFFDDLLKTDKKIDYKLCNVPKIRDDKNALNGQIVVMVKNDGDVVSPVCVSAMKDGKVVKTIWYDGFTGKVGLMFPGGDYDEFKIDQPENIPEIDRKNNTYYTHGLLHKEEPFKLQFAGSLDDPDHTQLFWLPAMGYNAYDKFMLGAAIYNHGEPGKIFEFTAVPMYSFGDKSLVGHADAFLNFKPDGFIHDFRIGANLNSYHYYTITANDVIAGDPVPDRRFEFTKIAPEVSFNFAKCYARSPVSQSLRLREILLRTNTLAFEGTSSGHSTTIADIDRAFFDATYRMTNNRKLSPYDLNVDFQAGESMNKLQATFNYHVTIMKGKNIDLRFFGGTFLNTSVIAAGPYRFRSSSWGPRGLGNPDYFFDNVFLGRSESTGLMAQQMAIADGGLKIPTAWGQTDQWLGAFNIAIPIPVQNKLLNKLKFYFDGAIGGNQNAGTGNFEYDGGIQLNLVRGDFCNVYFPLFYSTDIKDEIDANGYKYGNLIRFTFNLASFNPNTLANSIQL